MKTLLIIALAFLGGYFFCENRNRVTKEAYSAELKTTLNNFCTSFHESFSVKDGTFKKTKVSEVDFKLETMVKGNLELSFKDIQSLCMKKVVFNKDR